MKDEVNLEEILTRRGLLEKEGLIKNLIENKGIQQTTKVIICILFVAGLLGIAVVAPNLFSGLKFLKKNNKKISKREEMKFRNTFYQLRKRDLVSFERGDKAKLTPKGRREAFRILFENYKIQPQKKWDGTWKIVIFDVPNEKGRLRDILRQRLDTMGFFQMQKSVFVSPFQCKNELDAMCEVYGLWDYINYFEALHIDNEGDLRQYFGL